MEQRKKGSLNDQQIINHSLEKKALAIAGTPELDWKLLPREQVCANPFCTLRSQGLDAGTERRAAGLDAVHQRVAD